jgi:thioredoxin 1
MVELTIAPGTPRIAGACKETEIIGIEWKGAGGMASDNVLTITSDNFEEEVLQSDQPVLVDFWAEWCGPCKILGPTIEELANDFSGKAKVGKLNIDDHGEVAQRYQIASIPTVMLFQGGDAVEKMIGVRQKSEFAAALDKVTA